MKNRLTMLIVAIFCFLWAIPGFDLIPGPIDDCVAAVGGAYEILKLIQSFFQKV